MDKYYQGVIKMTERFIPKKRVALDGKVWWCVWDNYCKCWSRYSCHCKYPRKKDCVYAIDKYNKEWNLTSEDELRRAYISWGKGEETLG